MEPLQFYNYTKMQYTKTAISAPTILPRQPWNSPEAAPRDRTITPCSGPLRWPRKAAKHAPGSARHGGQKCSESFRPRVRKEASTLDRGCPLATAHLRYHLHCSAEEHLEASSFSLLCYIQGTRNRHSTVSTTDAIPFPTLQLTQQHRLRPDSILVAPPHSQTSGRRDVESGTGPSGGTRETTTHDTAAQRDETGQHSTVRERIGDGS